MLSAFGLQYDKLKPFQQKLQQSVQAVIKRTQNRGHSYAYRNNQSGGFYGFLAARPSDLL
jgi:hypothetical protein